MDPSQPTPKTGPTLVRDVTPPTSINAEVVNHIPVRNPLGSAASAQPQTLNRPIAPVRPTNTPPAANSPNQHATSPQAPSNPVKKDEKSAATTGPANHVPRPIAATIVACLVGSTLIAAAYYIYSQGL
jgi:hypothetical protein